MPALAFVYESAKTVRAWLSFSYLNCEWMHQRRLALVHRREELDRGRRTGGACGKLDVVGRCHFDGGGEPDHFKYGRDRRRSAGFEKLERPGVAAEAAMVGGVVRFGLRNQGGKLRDARHAQQQHDKQCFPVAVEVAHYGRSEERGVG